MTQKTIERKVGELDYRPGGKTTLDLPRSHYYERLNLVTNYEVEVLTAGATSPEEFGIEELVQDITVKINGNQTLKSYSHGMGTNIDEYQYSAKPVLNELDFSTASVQQGVMQTFVDFTIAPGDFAAMLPAFQTSDAVLEITWGVEDDIAQDGTEISINDATMNVETRERVRESVAGSNSGKESRLLDNLLAFKEREVTKSLDTTGEENIKLPRGNAYYATPFTVFNGDSQDNGLVDDFSIVEDGVKTHKDTTFVLAQLRDSQKYGVDNPLQGFVYPAFGTDADLSDVVSTQGIDDFELSLDVVQTPNSGSDVRVVTQEIIR